MFSTKLRNTRILHIHTFIYWPELGGEGGLASKRLKNWAAEGRWGGGGTYWPAKGRWGDLLAIQIQSSVVIS